MCLFRNCIIAVALCCTLLPRRVSDRKRVEIRVRKRFLLQAVVPVLTERTTRGRMLHIDTGQH